MVNSVQYMSASNPSRSFYLFSYPIYHSFTDSVTADQSINRSLREKERNVWLGRAQPGASVCRRWGLQQSPGFVKIKPAVLAASKLSSTLHEFSHAQLYHSQSYFDLSSTLSQLDSRPLLLFVPSLVLILNGGSCHTDELTDCELSPCIWPK